MPKLTDQDRQRLLEPHKKWVEGYGLSGQYRLDRDSLAQALARKEKLEEWFERALEFRVGNCNITKHFSSMCFILNQLLLLDRR